jgi:hypothetical protein
MSLEERVVLEAKIEDLTYENRAMRDVLRRMLRICDRAGYRPAHGERVKQIFVTQIWIDDARRFAPDEVDRGSKD